MHGGSAFFILPMPKRKASLNPKEEAFCRNYIVDWNGNDAAIKAGYSAKSARAQASRLLTRVNIQSRINQLKKKREARLDLKADDVLRELLKIAKSDLRQAFNDSGSLKSIEQMPDDIAAAIGGIDVDELFDGKGKDREMIGYTKKIKLWDKVRALELLGKHLKLFDVPEDAGTKAVETLGQIVKDVLMDKKEKEKLGCKPK